MEQYKQKLCFEYFGDDCDGEDDILRCIVANKQGHDYTYNLNAEGKLHSPYLAEFGCYEPAIIRREPYATYLYWLFNGEIKDCLHPFIVKIDKKTNNIRTIRYYSLERIRQLQPIYLSYYFVFVIYNRFTWIDKQIAIVDDPNIPSYTTDIAPVPCDMSQFVMIAPGIVCPLWSDEFVTGCIKFKFAD